MKRSLPFAASPASFHFAGLDYLLPTGFTRASGRLPASMRGCGLYSWGETGQTWFILLTGTN